MCVWLKALVSGGGCSLTSCSRLLCGPSIVVIDVQLNGANGFPAWLNSAIADVFKFKSVRGGQFLFRLLRSSLPAYFLWLMSFLVCLVCLARFASWFPSPALCLFLFLNCCGFGNLCFFSRLYLSSTGLVSVSDEYNLEKPSQNISKNVVFENIKN